MARYILCMSLAVLCPLTAMAELSVEKTGDSLVDSAALILGDKRFGKRRFGRSINGCSFQQDAVATHGSHQYVGYYDGNRRVCVARRRLPSGRWEIIRFQDYQFRNNDAHNTISIGICPADGTIHIAFDHHVHPLHYRVSKKGVATRSRSFRWDASLFGPILSELEKKKRIKVTYPRFFQTPDGGLQFCYRRGGSGNGDRMLVDYDPRTGVWRGTRQIDSCRGRYSDALGKSTSRCSYPNGYTYGPKGRLHATWVWRESSQGANHDLVYVYSTDQGKSWCNGAGDAIDGVPRVDSPGATAFKIDRRYGLMNTHGQAVDSRGRIHAVVRHCTDASLKAAGSKPGEVRFGPSAARRYIHYWRDVDGVWKQRELPGTAGSRPKLFLDRADNAFLICGKSGNLVIISASSSSRWTDWRAAHTEPGPFVSEMLGDFLRWKAEGVLSVMVQQSSGLDNTPTPLRILDFKIVAGR